MVAVGGTGVSGGTLVAVNDGVVEGVGVEDTDVGLLVGGKGVSEGTAVGAGVSIGVALGLGSGVLVGRSVAVAK
jgi:hypothetical protein